MTQDVTVEATAAEADNDVTVAEDQNVTLEPKDETQDEAQDESQDQSQADESPKEGEAEEDKPKTVEERLTAAEERAQKLEREAEAKQKKIDRQTAAYNELQRALEKERLERQAKVEQVEDNPEPKIDDFETYPEYVEALSNHKAELLIKQKEAEMFERQQAEKQQQLIAERASIAQEQEAEYLKSNPMYKASKAEFESFTKTAQFAPELENAIVSQVFKGNVPQIIDYFGANNGENMDELIAMSKMTPVEAGIEIYKIQQKLVTPKKEETKPLPKPIKAKPAVKKVKKLSDGDVLKNLGLK